MRTGGEPLPARERRFFEESLGYDFSRVRIHTDRGAAESARGLRAEAFTLGHDVAFAPGRFSPGTASGRHLLAHELTHVIQQGGAAPDARGNPVRVARAAAAGPRIARRVADREPAADGPSAAASPPAGGLIAEDDVQALLPGQERKTAWLAELRAAGCAAADRALAQAGRDTRGCPFVDKWLAHYAGRPAAHLERALRRFVPGSAGVSTAGAWVPLFAARISAGVESWVASGKVPDDAPDELRAELSAGLGGGSAGAFSSAVGAIGGALSAIGGLFFKSGPGGGARRGADRDALSARLGPGRPLDGGVRAKMEGAVGTTFAGVRVHDDARAAALSRDLGATAFTLGEHVAFSQGSYQPGTPAGDALLAHELAHVAQQGEAPASPEPVTVGGADDDLERDADRVAEGVVRGLWSGGGASRQPLRPRRGGGLRLQRCASGGGSRPGAVTPASAARPAAVTPATLSAATGPNTLDATARAIIAFAHDESVPLSERGPQLLQRILSTYFPADAGMVESITYKASDRGLTTLCPPITRPDPSLRCSIQVGDEYITNTTAVGISRRVLQLGHELDHIRQHRAGMGGAANKHMREFLGFYDEATNLEAAGTGRMRPGTKLSLIDEAIMHYNCFSAEDKASQASRYQRLLEVRSTTVAALGGTAPPTPTTCGPFKG